MLHSDIFDMYAYMNGKMNGWVDGWIFSFNRGRNNARSSDMTERIYYLMGDKFSQFQALSGHFVKRKLKII